MKKIILNDFARHIIMYAKNYYKKDDMMEDIKKIIAHIACIPKEYVSDDLIYRHAMSTFWALSGVESFKTETFLQNLFSVHYMGTHKIEILPKDMVGYLLGFITAVRMADGKGNKIVEIGKPDYNILPPDPKRIF